MQHLQQGPVLPSAVDHVRKRRYLSLLPPPQVIEICLTFDLHAPASAKSTIWPQDLDAAIFALQKPSEEKPSSLDKPFSSDKTSSSDKLEDSNPKPQEPPKALDVAAEAREPPGPPGPSAPAYQPQKFAYPSQPAYPHTPYYPQPSWSSYSQPYGSYAHHQSYYHETASTDDLPSYEDMIVEALTDDVRDPEGLAPKDLYTWMASHYPVQANFRPSASQALQKAYKRGRFEKSLSGKYRLNPNWKGGNTTRRTTRRPQTHASSAPPSFSHNRLSTTSAPYASKASSLSNSSYTLGYSSTSGTTPLDSRPEDELGDAYEAAQHILTTLNLGEGLYKISQDPEEDGSVAAGSSSAFLDAGDVKVESIRAELQVQLVLLAAQLSEVAGRKDSESTEPEPVVIPSAATTTSTSAVADPPDPSSVPLMVNSTQAALVNGLNFGVPGSSPAESSTTTFVPTSAIIDQPEPRSAGISAVRSSEVSKDVPESRSPTSSDEAQKPQQVLPIVAAPALEIPPLLPDIEDSDDEDMDEVIV